MPYPALRLADTLIGAAIAIIFGHLRCPHPSKWNLIDRTSISGTGDGFGGKHRNTHLVRLRVLRRDHTCNVSRLDFTRCPPRNRTTAHRRCPQRERHHSPTNRDRTDELSIGIVFRKAAGQTPGRGCQPRPTLRHSDRSTL